MSLEKNRNISLQKDIYDKSENKNEEIFKQINEIETPTKKSMKKLRAWCGDCYQFFEFGPFAKVCQQHISKKNCNTFDCKKKFINPNISKKCIRKFPNFYSENRHTYCVDEEEMLSWDPILKIQNCHIEVNNLLEHKIDFSSSEKKNRKNSFDSIKFSDLNLDLPENDDLFNANINKYYFEKDYYKHSSNFSEKKNFKIKNYKSYSRRNKVSFDTSNLDFVFQSPEIKEYTQNNKKDSNIDLNYSMKIEKLNNAEITKKILNHKDLQLIMTKNSQIHNTQEKDQNKIKDSYQSNNNNKSNEDFNNSVKNEFNKIASKNQRVLRKTKKKKKIYKNQIINHKVFNKQKSFKKNQNINSISTIDQNNLFSQTSFNNDLSVCANKEGFVNVNGLIDQIGNLKFENSKNDLINEDEILIKQFDNIYFNYKTNNKDCDILNINENNMHIFISNNLKSEEEFDFLNNSNYSKKLLNLDLKNNKQNNFSISKLEDILKPSLEIKFDNKTMSNDFEKHSELDKKENIESHTKKLIFTNSDLKFENFIKNNTNLLNDKSIYDSNLNFYSEDFDNKFLINISEIDILDIKTFVNSTILQKIIEKAVEIKEIKNEKINSNLSYLIENEQNFCISKFDIEQKKNNIKENRDENLIINNHFELNFNSIYNRKTFSIADYKLENVENFFFESKNENTSTIKKIYEIPDDFHIDEIFKLIHLHTGIPNKLLSELKRAIKKKGIFNARVLRLFKKKKLSWNFLNKIFSKNFPEIEAVSIFLEELLEK